MNWFGVRIKGKKLEQSQWNKRTSKDIGSAAELVVCHYLEKLGLLRLSINFHSRFGEIDLIFDDNHTIVFIEVKYRKSNDYGTAAEMVTLAKQKKIIKTAHYYLQQQGINAYNTACRFDVVTVTGSSEPYQIAWLKNAF